MKRIYYKDYFLKQIHALLNIEEITDFDAIFAAIEGLADHYGIKIKDAKTLIEEYKEAFLPAELEEMSDYEYLRHDPFATGLGMFERKANNMKASKDFEYFKFHVRDLFDYSNVNKKILPDEVFV
jgi:uncharacterized protein involved in high-affinity Fe2+ transport